MSCAHDKLTASDAMPREQFGSSVSLFGDVALVGAPDDLDMFPDSGSAYVYRHDGMRWNEEAKLLASDAPRESRVGYAVFVSGDVALVGAPSAPGRTARTGAAYVYGFDGTSWIETAKLSAGDGEAWDDFGCAVALDGNVALIGARYDDDLGDASGAAYVYRFDGTTWVEEARLVAADAAADDVFGWSVAVSGDVALVGARRDDSGRGAAYVFRYDGVSWVESVKLSPSDAAPFDYFGQSVSLFGSVALVGANYEDQGAMEGGSAYVFRHDGTSWVEESKLIASDAGSYDYFGGSVSVFGDVALIGATGDDDGGRDAGAAYVYRYDGTSWLEESKFVAPDALDGAALGSGVSVHGDVALVGAEWDAATGSAYAYHVASCARQALLRDDSILSLSPPTPAIATLLPLDPVLDVHVPGFASGGLDPDAAVLDDSTRPLVLYGVDGDVVLRLVVATGRRVRVMY